MLVSTRVSAPLQALKTLILTLSLTLTWIIVSKDTQGRGHMSIAHVHILFHTLLILSITTIRECTLLHKGTSLPHVQRLSAEKTQPRVP